MTPGDTMVNSGTRLTSPSVLTSGLVPDICTYGGGAVACEADNGAMAAKMDMIGTLVLIRHLLDKRVIPVTNLPATGSTEDERHRDYRSARRPTIRRYKIKIGRASCRERVCQYV